MSLFDKAFEDLIEVEKGYSNNPADPGGETMWGITIATARRYGYMGPMKDMPLSVAKDIYKSEYWWPEFENFSYALIFQIFDAIVNSGLTMATRWLQTAVGTTVDGKFGPETLAAMKIRDPLKLIMLFNAERLEFMTDRTIWPDVGKGWARRISKNLKIGAS